MLTLYDIHQGDLVLIYHKTIPQKSGWYREMRDSKRECQVLALECPVHVNFDENDPEVAKTKKVDGVFTSTLPHAQKKISCKEYIILATCCESFAVRFTRSGYQLTKEIANCMKATDAGKVVIAGLAEMQGYEPIKYTEDEEGIKMLIELQGGNQNG